MQCQIVVKSTLFPPLTTASIIEATSSMAARYHSEETQPLHEDSVASETSKESSFTPRRSSSSASTTSLVLHHLNNSLAKDKDNDFYSDGKRLHLNDFQELDIEDRGQPRGRPIDRRLKRWLYILAAVCATGWLVALVLFINNGSYKHRSSIPHNPDATSSPGSGRKITIDQLQTGQWYVRSHGISWVSGTNEEDGLLLETGSGGGKGYLVVEDVRSMEDPSVTTGKKTLMQSQGFEAGGKFVVSQATWPSSDLKTVLVMTERAHNWRHSYTGKYYLFDVETQTGQPLDPSQPDARIQLAQWSPKSDSIVFTRDNNMFIRDLRGSSVAQITTDGGEEMFNGVPDWVYEEEVFSGNSATWFSQDGKFVAFLATNESGVPEYPVQYFVSRPSNTAPEDGLESYPEVRQIKYPKAGAPNPVVHLKFYDVRQKAVFSVPIKDDFDDDDRLITEVIWAGPSGKVLIRQTNRESDILKMVLIDVSRRTGEIVRTQDVNALDGGWFEVSETTTYIPSDPANGRPHDGYIDTIINNGYDHLAYFTPLDNPEPIVLTSGKWEVVAAPSAVDLTNNLIYFVATKESSIQRHVYKVKLDGSGFEPMTDTSKEGYYSVSFSKAAGYALLTYQGPDIPWQKVISTPSNPNTFAHTIEDNAALAHLASETELPIKLYSTINVEGFDLNVLERRPPGFDPHKRYPVLFYLYGGPGSQTVDKKFSVDFQSYVASTLGYVVVTVDGRGTGFIGREARCVIRGNLGYYEAYDQIATAKAWAGKSYVDESRIAIWGWSYGGFMTLKTLEQDAGQTFQYGMAVAPVTDWRFYGIYIPSIHPMSPCGLN